MLFSVFFFASILFNFCRFYDFFNPFEFCLFFFQLPQLQGWVFYLRFFMFPEVSFWLLSTSLLERLLGNPISFGSVMFSFPYMMQCYSALRKKEILLLVKWTCRYFISNRSQRKTNSAWYSLYVEFNPKKVKIIEIESRKVGTEHWKWGR